MVISISEYEKIARSTDQFSRDDLQPILLGLFGEVGSVMSAVKKLKRESRAFIGFQDAVIDELGDTFWYFAALVRRHDLVLADLMREANIGSTIEPTLQATDDPARPFVTVQEASVSSRDIAEALLHLGQAAASLIDQEIANSSSDRPILVSFIRAFFAVTASADISFNQILSTNARKIIDRFVMPELSDLPDFNADFPEEEQLPREFQIEVRERANGKVYLRWNNVFIGDPLTDNIREEDGFRYHDVIHFAHVAILHWSPTIRSLIKQKRKSNDGFDEEEDGGRGSVVEEGLAAWVFSKAKELDYFEGHDKISIDILKTIQDFIKGYEVEACPAALWERAILTGYAVFREVRKNKGGLIVGSRESRTLEYRPLEASDGQ